LRFMNDMRKNLSLGFFIENLVVRGPLTWLEVLESSFLFAGPDGSPSVGCHAPARPADAFRVEPVAFALQARLLLVSPERRTAAVNGVPAPRVALLSIKDQVEILQTHLLHVSGFFRPVIGPPGPELVNEMCMVCQTPFKADTRIVRCWCCNLPLHAEGEERPAADRLECARLHSSCPRCSANIMWSEGFVYIPES
jgi:hypothetical protein